MKQASLFNVNETESIFHNRNDEREIAELKEQLQEVKEESFRRLHRIADLEQQLQKRPSAMEATAADEQLREKIRDSIQAIRACLDAMEKQFETLIPFVLKENTGGMLSMENFTDLDINHFRYDIQK